jgi:phage baseplate assembly protein W
MTNEIVGRGWSFRLQMGPHVGSQGGIALTSDQTELEQAIGIILSTTPGQRVMRPTFGCRLYELVFAPNNAQTRAQAQRYVEEALGMWEPRIRVVEVNVQSAGEQNGDAITRESDEQAGRLFIEIKYEIKATHDQRSLVYPFYLIPEE